MAVEKHRPKKQKSKPEKGIQEIEIPEEADEDGLCHLRIDIRRALPGRRLDKYLAGRLGRFSRTALQQYIREGAVTVNGKVVKPSYTIQTGDVIEMLLPEPEEQIIEPEPIPLEIIYEDDDIIVINKQAGLIVHPAKGNPSGTLLNALAYHLQSSKASNEHAIDLDDLPDRGDKCRAGIVHRLDKDTTGVMVLAKSELALWRLGRQFELRRVHKTYRAIVHGLVELDEDVIDAPIGAHPHIRERYAVRYSTEKDINLSPSGKQISKPAITRYRVLERLSHTGCIAGGFTFIELYPKTGRTHQLRVHMSFIGHPIVGDRTYGGGPIYQSQLDGVNDQAYGPIITRQALHAAVIEFQHPRTLKMVRFEAPLPEDFRSALKALNSKMVDNL